MTDESTSLPGGIPAERLDAAAAAAFAAMHGGVAWAAISDAGRVHWRNLARQVLAAALIGCAVVPTHRPRTRRG
jgi:hypothetical protein